MKHVIFALLALLVCLQPMAVGATDEDLTITVSQVEFCAGSVAQIEVAISANPGYSHITAEIIYDAACLKLTEVEPVNMHSMFADNVEANRIAAAGINDLHGDGVMFVLHFEVLQTGEHTVTVNLESLGNADGDVLNAVVNPGAIYSRQHSYRDYSKDPTCTEFGVSGQKCDFCGDLGTSEFIPALGHTLEDEGDVICKVCGKDTSKPEDDPSASEPAGDGTTGTLAGNRTWMTVLLIVLAGMVLALTALVVVLLRRRSHSHGIPIPELDDLDDYFEEETGEE